MIRKGFTLIELLVVITILAILAGAALPYVQNYVAESRIAKAKTDLEEVARALAVYETREGEYVKGNVSDLTGRYLNKAPIDPWGKPYLVATASGLVISSKFCPLTNPLIHLTPSR
jgi:general secretion pathway protein G